MDPAADVFSPQIYSNYLVLDSVLIYYLDIESLIQRHQVKPEAFETREALNLLARRFDLPSTTSFQAFLNRYDAKYATVRSYFLPGAKRKAIMLKAAEAGNLQAFYLGLRRNPKYKNPAFLVRALQRAARGNHQVMIDLIKDLGGTSIKHELHGTAQGGHLEKLKLLIAQGPGLGQSFIFKLTKGAVRFGHLATVKYLITLWIPAPIDFQVLSQSAGKSGNQEMIDYIISQGGDNYTQLILGAISGGHHELAIRYMEKPELDYCSIFIYAIRFNYLDLAKLVARDHKIDQAELNELMSGIPESETYEIIDYLISLGADNYDGLISQLAIYDYIELFKRYYLGPGVDYVQVFDTSLIYSSMKVVKFMLDKHLVPVTEGALNSYLSMVGLNPKLIELLFSLGATDYQTIVERALFRGDLELAEKYLTSKGRLKQKAVDTTLARLKQSNDYVEAKKYLRSLNLKGGGSTRSSSSSSSSD